MLASPRGRIDFGGYMQVAEMPGCLAMCSLSPQRGYLLNQVLHGGLELAARMTLDRELAAGSAAWRKLYRKDHAEAIWTPLVWPRRRIP